MHSLQEYNAEIVSSPTDSVLIIIPAVLTLTLAFPTCLVVLRPVVPLLDCTERNFVTPFKGILSRDGSPKILYLGRSFTNSHLGRLSDLWNLLVQNRDWFRPLDGEVQ